MFFFFTFKFRNQRVQGCTLESVIHNGVPQTTRVRVVRSICLSTITKREYGETWQALHLERPKLMRRDTN